MTSLSMKKRVCALLVVLGALGTVVGSATPVDAQTGPQGVVFGERYRVVSWITPAGNCIDTRYDPERFVQVPYGQYREPYLGYWSCGRADGSLTFIGDWYTHAELGFNGWAWAEYRLHVYALTGSGARTNCATASGGPVTAWSWLNRSVTQHFPFFWSQAAASSLNGPNTSDSNGYVRLNCGRHGSIRVYIRASEGIGTF